VFVDVADAAERADIEASLRRLGEPLIEPALSPAVDVVLTPVDPPSDPARLKRLQEKLGLLRARMRAAGGPRQAMLCATSLVLALEQGATDVERESHFCAILPVDGPLSVTRTRLSRLANIAE
jgi:hypothetical protein